MTEAINFKDGDLLPGGLVVSLKRGYPVAAYRCACGREQTARIEGSVGGLSEATARSVGWNLADGGWMCPFCSGDADRLFQIFKPFQNVAEATNDSSGSH